MTENPCDVITEQSAKIPLLTGINHDDGAMQSSSEKYIFEFFQ